mgnify:CR=1 FL=1
MKQKTMVIFTKLLIFTFIFTLFTVSIQAATTITYNQTGTQDGYDYELWRDSGNTSMTLNSGGTFSCQWYGIGNVLFRKGKKFDSTQTYQQIGNISINYGATFNPGGNSYLCVYGWTKSPLVEFYIVDNWGTYRPTGAYKGSINVDGGTYDIYQTTRYNMPSIIGDTTFNQYWSVRRSKRSSGTISVSEHFKKWESLGMQMGKMFEVAFTVEGYQSNGSANVYTNTLTLGGSSSTSTSTSTSTVTNNTDTKMECESMTKDGQYTGDINSPFSGVALYANDDSVKFKQNFESGTHSFSLRGCSNNSNMAEVDLKIGGEYKGTFYYGGSYPAVYTIDDVSHKTGEQLVELIVTSDDGNWDAYLDYFTFDGLETATPTPTITATPAPTTATTTSSSTESKIECESMTKGGKYTGNISSPFSGVALYANNDLVKFTHNFESATNSFSLRACSNNSNMAKVDLKIGGQYKGTFYYGGSYPAVYTIDNVSHGTGDQEIELIVTSDDGNWDAYLDYLEIN